MKPFIEVLSNRELWDIHCASLDILENVGVDVHDQQARELLLNAGAKTDGAERIRLPAKLVKASLDKCSPKILMASPRGKRRSASVWPSPVRWVLVSVFLPAVTAPQDGSRF